MLVGMGINCFFIPHHLLDGGTIGISLIIFYYFQFPIGFTMMAISFPIYLFAFVTNRYYFIQSIFGMVCSAISLNIFSFMSTWKELPIPVSALIDGSIVGIGIGLMLRIGMTTEAVDLGAQIFGHFMSWNIGIVIFLIDTIILLAGLAFISVESFMHSFLAISATGFFTSILVKRGNNLS